MSFDDDDYRDQEYDLHENCVAEEDVVPFVREHHWAEVEDLLRESRAEQWLAKSKACLDLLSIVSQRDRAHLRGGLKKLLRKGHSSGDEVTEEQLFAIAADVSAFLEQFPIPTIGADSPYLLSGHKFRTLQEPTPSYCMAAAAKSCSLEDNLNWAKDLLTITKAFRDFLSAVSDVDLEDSYLQLRIREPLQTINYFLARAPALLLVNWQTASKQPAFGRCPDPDISDLAAYLAEWVSDYAKDHLPDVGLGVCAECGKFFPRERRDKTFCSKTCQNRVAYKRKKILESDALEKVAIAPDDACDIVAGFWMHHPRFGIGLIEDQSSASKSSEDFLKNVTGEHRARFRSMLSRRIILQVRFLHGVRMLTFTDLFEAQKKEDQLPDFYKVRSEETLAELL